MSKYTQIHLYIQNFMVKNVFLLFYFVQNASRSLAPLCEIKHI